MTDQIKKIEAIGDAAKKRLGEASNYCPGGEMIHLATALVIVHEVIEEIFEVIDQAATEKGTQ